MFNANNYGYNPQGRYVPQYMEQPQPTYMTQPQVQRPTLNGKIVDSLDVVRATDIGLSGETFFFPLTDNSAIITKQLSLDGTSKITVFKPVFLSAYLNNSALLCQFLKFRIFPKLQKVHSALFLQ